MIVLNTIDVQPIKADWLQQKSIALNVLRLDELHPVVSGNKWFKLQYYLQDAVANGYNTIGTFGGAYSNHIVATAFACKEKKLFCIGMIRGEEPQHLSHTLLQAQQYGMKLQFISREAYRNKAAVTEENESVYWINEGGYGSLGAAGAADIRQCVLQWNNYTHIVCATGTGTTLAGLINSALPHQTIIGISALKKNVSITEEVQHLLTTDGHKNAFFISHQYHFGGYAKYTTKLLQFMNEVWQKHGLPTDFVYTAKALYGLQDMILHTQTMPSGSRVLFIHTGGLQGNLSLPESVLAF